MTGVILNKPDVNHVVVQVGRKLIAWVFGYEQSYHLYIQHVLPWALPGASIVDSDTWDFAVFVGRFYDDSYDGRELNFVLCGEAGRYPSVPGRTYVFTQGEAAENHDSVRYCPTMIMWCPPKPVYEKTKALSVVDSGQHAWRVDLIKEAQAKIPALEIHGRLSGRPIPGHHDVARESPYANDKYLAIQNHAFVLAMERDRLSDYITEKVIDPILMGSVPIYLGAPNIGEYFVEGSFIPFEELHSHDWANWRGLYASKIEAVRRQHEILRTKFNVFSYFDLLTNDLSILSKKRPITL